MKKFTVTKDHLKLLRGMSVSWWACEFGAPTIDCKRPYGNSGVYQIHKDMMKILRMDVKFKAVIDEKEYDIDGSEANLPNELVDKLNRLHQETEVVLQIVLATGLFTPGKYAASDYKKDWAIVQAQGSSE